METQSHDERNERRREASELIGGGPLTPEELAGDYVLRDMPRTSEKAREGPQKASGDAGPLTLDVEVIRRSAQRGEPQTAAIVLTLCDRLRSMQRLAEHAIARRVVDRIDLDEVLDAARAYFEAVDRGDGIAAAEQALRRVIEGCQ